MIENIRIRNYNTNYYAQAFTASDLGPIGY